jgi:hypothetical protein
MVMPLNVTVNAADALIVAADVRSTTDVAPVAVQSSLKPGTLLAPSNTTGVTEGAKKPGGYIRVMALLCVAKSIEFGLKEIVTETFVLPANRSEESISNKTYELVDVVTVCTMVLSRGLLLQISTLSEESRCIVAPTMRSAAPSPLL